MWKLDTETIQSAGIGWGAESAETIFVPLNIHPFNHQPKEVMNVTNKKIVEEETVNTPTNNKDTQMNLHCHHATSKNTVEIKIVGFSIF